MAFVCHAVAGLRRRPDRSSELLTQELLGHRVRVLRTSGDFARCRLRDGYTGWMPVSALADRRYRATHFVKKRFAWVRGEETGPILLPMGCRIKVNSAGKARYIVEMPDGLSGAVGGSALGRIDGGSSGPSDLPGILEEVVGTPYLWGGKSTLGFDCSGLVQFVFGLIGIDLPRDSRDQAGRGRLVKHLGSLRSYDLLFFGTHSRIDHVAIHLGELDFIHASGRVRVESLAASRPGYRSDLHPRYRFARRLPHVQG